MLQSVLHLLTNVGCEPKKCQSSQRHCDCLLSTSLTPISAKSLSELEFNSWSKSNSSCSSSLPESRRISLKTFVVSLWRFTGIFFFYTKAEHIAENRRQEFTPFISSAKNVKVKVVVTNGSVCWQREQKYAKLWTSLLFGDD